MEAIINTLKVVMYCIVGFVVVAIVLGLLTVAATIGAFLIAFGWAIVIGIIALVLVISGIRELFGDRKPRKR